MTRSNKTAAARTSRTPAVVPNIVLKTVHDAILKDNKAATITTKKMRVRLRATPAMRAIHTANASWIFTAEQADAVRAMFDAPFAARLAARAKKAQRAPKPAKVATPVAADAGE